MYWTDLPVLNCSSSRSYSTIVLHLPWWSHHSSRHHLWSILTPQDPSIYLNHFLDSVRGFLCHLRKELVCHQLQSEPRHACKACSQVLQNGCPVCLNQSAIRLALLGSLRSWSRHYTIARCHMLTWFKKRFTQSYSSTILIDTSGFSHLGVFLLTIKLGKNALEISRLCYISIGSRNKTDLRLTSVISCDESALIKAFTRPCCKYTSRTEALPAFKTFNSDPFLCKARNSIAISTTEALRLNAPIFCHIPPVPKKLAA